MVILQIKYLIIKILNKLNIIILHPQKYYFIGYAPSNGPKLLMFNATTFISPSILLHYTMTQM